MPTKAKTTVGKTPACLDKSGEDGHLGGGKIRRTGAIGPVAMVLTLGWAIKWVRRGFEQQHR
jgi:hypothetical protein